MMTPAYRVELDAEAIGAAMRLPVDKLIRAFRDGRVLSRFVELWAEDWFGLTKFDNTNHKSTDGYYEVRGGERFEISMRVLTERGIRFQDSKYQGAGRTCTVRDLKKSIRQGDRWIVFDGSGFPVVTAYKLKTSLLEAWIDEGLLGTNGLTYDKFINLLFRDARPMVRQLEFPCVLSH